MLGKIAAAGGDRDISRRAMDPAASPGHCAAVGEALAQLHLADADFKLKRANALSIESWRPLYEHAKPRDSVRPAFVAKSPRSSMRWKNRGRANCRRA